MENVERKGGKEVGEGRQRGGKRRIEKLGQSEWEISGREEEGYSVIC